MQQVKNIVVGLERHLFFWLHNDWLQILFEQGPVGLVSVLVLSLYALKKSFRRPYLFGAGCAYCAVMLGNYPLRMALPSFIGVFLLAAVLRKR